MTATPNSFLKIIPITVSSGEASVGIVNRTYSDRIENSSTVEVYYNGQLIPGGLHPVTPTSKFYYDLTITLGTINGTTGADSGSSAVFVLRTNPSYEGPGYTSGTSTSTLSVFDSFNISYYYVVYTV